MFKTELNEFIKANCGKHRIKIEEATPVALRNRQIPKFWETEIDKQVRNLKKCGIIRDSKSPWASSVVPVKKKNGEIRLCINF